MAPIGVPLLFEAGGLEREVPVEVELEVEVEVEVETAGEEVFVIMI
jgi:hypothetical protein